MPGNSLGQLFRITTFGESHGPAIGVVIDGCPSNLEISHEEIQVELDRRRPGQSELTSPRSEEDKVEILSGIFEGKTLGTPIALLIRNKDARPEDYEELRNAHRKGHADETYDAKYGHRDHRGGGRASARETAARVAAGAIAKKLLSRENINITGEITQIGTEKNHTKFDEEILAAKEAGDSIGGIIEVIIKNTPAGLGEPVFNKLNADLSRALMSIPSARGIEFGDGFALASLRGSENKHDSGILGGISTGQDIKIRLAFKPTSSTPLNGVEGRHDPCVVPRALPIAEAMVALVLADHYLMQKRNA